MNYAALAPAFRAEQARQAQTLASVVITTGEIVYGEVQKRLRGVTLRYRSGALARSVSRTTVANRYKTVTIVAAGSAAVPYARIHEEGGEIRAKRAPYLVFRSGKGWVKRKSVQMPKRQYMRPSAEAGWRWFRQELPRRLEG